MPFLGYDEVPLISDIPTMLMHFYATFYCVNS